MFNFFRDMILEVKGLDMEQVYKERKEKQMLKKEKTVFLPTDIKVVMNVFSGVSAIALFFFIRKNISDGEYLFSVLHFVMAILNFATIILTVLRKKKTEIIGLICFVIYVVLLYASALAGA